MFIELVVPFTLKSIDNSMTSALFTEVIGRLQHFDSIVPSSHQLVQVIINNIFSLKADLVIQFQKFIIN